MARLAFLAQGGRAALDAAIDVCLARTERTLYTRWRAISFLVRVHAEPPALRRFSIIRCGARERWIA